MTSERERYVRRNRRLEDRPTPLAGKIILFLAGFVLAAMILLLASPAWSHQTMVYCQNQYGQIFTYPNSCPPGMKFVGVKG